MLTPLIILALLTLPYILLAPVPALRRDPARRACIGLSLVFCFTGVGHFITPDAMSDMIPPLGPLASPTTRLAIIYLTGPIEIAAGLATLPARARTAAGLFLIALLIGFLPFNIYAAINHIPLGGHAWGPAYLLIRIPLQAILIAWCWWFAARPR
ncbi:MAG: hypothetical protein KF745_13820 [Phycisphaeraceae bacterium]|nr:hypothetical protein [Phycisphaeraceae bacterium]